MFCDVPDAREMRTTSRPIKALLISKLSRGGIINNGTLISNTDANHISSQPTKRATMINMS
ncbi:MAG: hypothetical protein R6U96_14635 [Promethearchaeia archaeon]